MLLILPANRLMIANRYRWFVIVGGTLLLALVSAAFIGAAIGHDPSPARLPANVWAHIFTVLPALPLGMWLFLHPKGTDTHRWLGRLWVALIVVTAAISFTIRNLNHGQFSYIHLLSTMVILMVPYGLVLAWRGQIEAHSRVMRGMFLGSLLIAGLATFAPGRVMWAWAFG